MAKQKVNSSKQKVAKKKSTHHLAKFNKLRSRIWKKEKHNLKSYAETAKLASYVLKKSKSRRKKGAISNKYIHQNTLAWKKIIPVAEVKPVKVIPEKPEHPDFNVEYDHFQLDEIFDSLVREGMFNGLTVRDKYTGVPDFKLGDYSYSSTFQSFVDERNEAATGKSGEFMFVITPVYDEVSNEWVLVLHDVDESADLGASSVPQPMDVQPSVSKPSVIAPKQGKKTSSNTKKVSSQLKEIGKAMVVLEKMSEKLIKEIGQLKKLKMNKQAKKSMADLAEIKKESTKLNKRYLKLSKQL